MAIVGVSIFPVGIQRTSIGDYIAKAVAFVQDRLSQLQTDSNGNDYLWKPR